MRTLRKKALRELLAMRGQACAIVLVIASGVATFVLSTGTMEALQNGKATFYRDYRFADIFVALKRAPERLRARFEAIPGVEVVDTRVKAEVKLDVAGFADPVNGLLISIPARDQTSTNQLYLRSGALPEPHSNNQVVISEAFAQAHHLVPGDQLDAIITGQRQSLRIVGIGLSPEFIYQIRPGDLFPDYDRYAILWMERKALGSAYGMDGAFNSAAIMLSRSAKRNDVIARLDELLLPYGGHGAYAVDEQLSERYLAQEFESLATMATLFPMIFLGVSAFLLNIVTSRLIATQRDQIGTLKAFGYSDASIALHYASIVAVIALTGALVGTILGAWLGRELSALYQEFFRLPFVHFMLRPWMLLVVVLTTMAAAMLGTWRALHKVVVVPPAEAMRPEPPAAYRRILLERLGAGRILDQPTRMIVRHINRYPLKSVLTLTGIAFSVAVMMVGNFQKDAIAHMIDVQFNLIAREDLTMQFAEPLGHRALYELQHGPGVDHVEGFRTVPARVRFEHRSYRTSVLGLNGKTELHRLLGQDLTPIELPEAGLLLTEHLAGRLGARPGDVVLVEVLEGKRPTIEVPLVGLVGELVGESGYMEVTALNRLMGEGAVVTGAFVALNAALRNETIRKLKETPKVVALGLRDQVIRNLQDTMADTLLTFTFINALLGGAIAFGVVFNCARIALSERAWELASLRVLGFSQGEVAYILLGELAILTLFAVPVGFLVGRELCRLIAANLASDLYRVPLILSSTTYAFATSVVLAAALLSGWLMKLKVDRLDLVSALKARE